MKKHAVLFAGGIALVAAGWSSVQAQTPAACAALHSFQYPATRIAETHWQAAGEVISRAADGTALHYQLPAHCVVEGVVAPYNGKDGRAYGVRFELRLPGPWNGRFLFQGGGGLDGAVRPAYGEANGATPALARGFAVVSMDGGHEGMDASFAATQQARLDYAYQAVGKATAVAKATITAFYAHPPRYSYFEGCSNGGREAMVAAQRYPLEFDGIVAGDPGFRLAHAALAEAWNNQHWARIAPKEASGAPDIASALSDGDLKLVTSRLLADCDALDGLRDGIINNPAACHFRPQELLCAKGGSAQCLSQAKIDALNAVFGGAHDSAGRALYSGFAYDAGISAPNWRMWMLGTPHQMKSLNEILGAASLSLYDMTPAQPGRNPYTLDADHAEAAIAQTAAINDATGTKLDSFADHGGKLLIYQGGSDPVFSALDIQDWDRALAAQDPHAADYARLFMVPGMTHCSGGPATDHFDPLTAIQSWVEQRQAPTRLIATGAALPGQSRPLCVYPAYARYEHGDPRDAKSFACVTP